MLVNLNFGRAIERGTIAQRSLNTPLDANVCLTGEGDVPHVRRLNIRLSSKDLEAIQKRALTEGLPYQTLISSLLHKYASGRLKEL